MAADRKVRIVIRNPAWKGKWFFCRQNERGLQEYTDDVTKAALFTPEFGVHARDKFRALRNDVYLEDTLSNGPLFESESSPVAQTDRYSTPETRFVALVGGGVDGKGYFVNRNPQRGWYIRATDVPSMRAEHRDKETIWGDNPEAVVSKLLELWGLEVAVPIDDPQASARAEQERNRVAQQKQFVPGIRPGDRR